MNRSSTAVPAAPEETVRPALDGIPGQRGPGRPTRSRPSRRQSGAREAPADPASVWRRLRPWRLLPTPTGTPFTFGYAVVLAGTSLLTRYADPDFVSALHQGSSTDVAHLMQQPLLVLARERAVDRGRHRVAVRDRLPAVLTGLERRIGALRTAGVFLLGHVVATLATEVPGRLLGPGGPSAGQLPAPARLRHQLRRRGERRRAGRAPSGRGCGGWCSPPSAGCWSRT